MGHPAPANRTFAREHFGPNQVVSSDELRAWLADDPNDQDASAEAFRILALVLNGRLRRRLTAVVDATNLRRVNRQRLRSLAARYGVPVVAILFNLPEGAFYDNNARRPDRRVADDVVANQIELLRQAAADVPGEGYARVVVIGA